MSPLDCYLLFQGDKFLGISIFKAINAKYFVPSRYLPCFSNKSAQGKEGSTKMKLQKE
jgi:hypothetical protein